MLLHIGYLSHIMDTWYNCFITKIDISVDSVPALKQMKLERKCYFLNSISHN